MKKLLLFLTCMGGFFAGLYAQTWQYYRAPSVFMALLSENVKNITVAPTGDIWASTWGGGLSKFNGTTWQTYTTANFPFLVNDISGVVIDNEGAAWIATNGGGIHRFSASVTSYNIDNNGAFLSNFILSASKDQEGNLWFGTDGGGVLKWDGTSFSTIYKNNSGLGSNNIRQILADHAGNIWFATWGGGLSKFDGSTWVTYTTGNSDLKSDFLYDLAEDRDGNIWIATHVSGIFKFTVSTQSFKNYNPTNSLFPGEVQTVAVDPQNNVWVGSPADGLFKFAGGFWSKYDANTSGLASNTVNKITFDQNGAKWIATGAGISKFDDANWVVYNKETTKGPGPLTNDLVANFMDHNGDQWLISSPSNITRFDGSNWTHFNHDNSNLPLTVFTSIAEDTQGNIWVGTTEHGAFKYDGSIWSGYSTGNSQIADNHITSIACDQQGNLWFGSFMSGLTKFDGQNWSVIPPFSNGFNGQLIKCLLPDSQQNLWIGTLDGGLYKFHDNTFTAYAPNITTVNAKSVTAITMDPSGNLWLGSPNGLLRFDGQNWQQYSISNSPLINPSINSLTADQQGNIWIGTAGGLSVFNGSQWATFVQGANSLAANRVNSVLVDANNNKWVATGNGGLCELLDGMIPFQAQRKWYVRKNGSSDGSSWTTASGDLAETIAKANSGDSIFVAAGTYQPAMDSFFVLKPGVRLFGGFQGTENQFSDRNLAAGHETILKGNGSAIIVNDNNGLTSSTVLDGFTLTEGMGYSAFGSARGGAIFNNYVSPSIAHCTFNTNTADVGGAAFSQAGGVSFQYCRFIGNKVTSDFNGGAIYDERSSSSYNGCIFSQNQAGNVTGTSGAGGAVALVSSFAVFNSCLFDHNKALGKNDGGGGAIFIDKSQTNINNCTFYGNQSAALLNTQSAQGNTLSIDTYGSGQSQVLLLNTIIYGQGDHHIAQLNSSSLSVNYSVIKGYGVDYNGDGVINDQDVKDNISYNTNPLFMDELAGDYRLKPTSPCISAGSPLISYPMDLAGNDRVRDGKIDLGAYQSRGLEFHGTPGQQLTSNRADTAAGGVIYLYNNTENSVIVGVNPNGQNLGSIKATGSLSENYGSGSPTTLESPFGITGEVHCLNRSWHVELTKPDFNSPVTVRFFIDTTDLRDLITEMPENTKLPHSLEEWKAFAPLIQVYKVAGDNAYAANATNYKQYTFSDNNETADLTHFIIGQYQQLFYLEFMVSEFSSGSVAYIPLTTPIQLLDFAGTLKNGQADFRWQTGEEVNFQQFDLQNSTDNSTYSTIAVIQPKGNNSSYQFSISQNDPSAFYRLKLIDQNGKHSFSSVIRLSQPEQYILLYPNPAKDFIKFRTQKPAMAYLYDQTGRLIFSKEVIKGENKIPVDNLSAGVYYIKLNTKRLKFIKK